MAHLPPKTVAEFTPLSQSKTLFLPAPGTLGVLFTPKKSGFTHKPMKFENAHEALDWCQENRAGLIFFFNADPAVN